ncbi:MAG TPA: ferrous iron transport protein B [Bryobacteraceae bacterium]|nr:ferrous iron transport protein B [Bryobacteraceae bacterium]
MSGCHDCASSCTAKPEAGSAKPRTVAIVGPPNSGKSTLFNQLTGLRQKVANFPGVTVEQHTGEMVLDGGREITLIDLPGIYSLTPRSEDEQVSHDVLKGLRSDTPKPDAVLLILDATNLSRHLMLAAPVLALGLPTLVILNMADDLRHRGGEVETEALARELGAPVTLISARQGDGLEAIYEFLAGALAIPTPITLPVLSDVPKCRVWAGRVGSNASYLAPAPPKWTRRLDAVFLHPVIGPLVFVFLVVLVFQTMFTAAAPLMDAVGAAVAWSGDLVGALLPESVLRSLLIEGVWGGVGSVLVFLPQILLLFLFLGVLEDSGYLARAALIADRTMARVGLQGKSFIPLLSAYACAVPAVLATRTIENKRDRIATILIAPFMTCSARLPVYTLIIAAFIPNQPVLGGFLGSRAAAMLGLYLLGFAAAVATARILKSSVLKSGRAHFVLEMPPYRWPTVRSLGLRLYDRAKVFLRRAGTVILAAAIIIWLLSHLPLDNGKAPAVEHSLAGTIGRTIEPLIAPLGFNWKIGIGLITSLAAREVIVGTLGTIYGIDAETHDTSLYTALQRDLTLGGAVALLVFFAFAMQCMSTIAVVRRETGGWRWPVLQFVYMSALAWVGAFVANRAVGLFWAA